MKYLLNCRNFISLVVLFSFFDNFGTEEESVGNNSCYSFQSDYSFEHNNRVKIVFVGDTGVGKTQIISRINNDPFNGNYDGIDFRSKEIIFRGHTIKMQIWDTAGQEKFKCLIPNYVRNSSIVFLIYDVSVKKTFENIPNWISLIKSIKDNEDPTLVLCGNKIDISERQVKKEEGEALAQKEGIAFCEVSAKTGDEIKNMIYSSVADLSIFKKCNLDKESLVKELLQENENKNENKKENKNENKNGNGSVNKKEKENKNENKNGNGSVNKKEKEKENENGNGNGDTAKLINNDNFTYTKNTERCSLCSRCINCCKNCFNSD